MALVAVLVASVQTHSPRDMAAALAPEPKRARTSCISIGGDVTGKWCDMTCGDTPDDSGCKIYCDCPSLEERAAEQAKAAETKKAAGGCKSKVATVTNEWCDGACAENPDSENCEDMCKCPCIKEGGCKKIKIPNAPEPRILGGWTNCNPEEGSTVNVALRTRRSNWTSAMTSNPDPSQQPVGCEKDEAALLKITGNLPDVMNANEMRQPSYAASWGSNAILPGRFGGYQIAPFEGEPSDYKYYWLTFGGEGTDSANWAESAEQDIIDAGATGAAFDMEGGVQLADMTAWIKEMREKHPEWTYVHVPKAAGAGDFVQYDPEGGSPDFVAPMLYYTNYNSYPKMDISKPSAVQSEAVAAMKELLDAGWPPSRTILTYQSFDAARVRAIGDSTLLPFLGKLLGDFSVELSIYGEKFSLTGPYAGVLGWPAQCGSGDRRCWPEADRSNMLEVVKAARANGVHIKVPH
jgi:hypothetical protein